ncbi:MAG: PHP domain-containing protein [Corallococcus sp.]|nr:PHP domain-containing protein [Corallococcus sp.]
MIRGFYDCSVKNVKIKSNFHTHNYLCGHAVGTVSDYVKEAVKFGYDVIGISDHCASPVNDETPYVTPQTLKTLYLPQFKEAEKLYGDKIKILSAVEIEYFEGFDDYYAGLLKDLDYLVMGQHEYMLGDKRKNSFFDGTDEKNVLAYFDSVRKGILSGHFSLVAHPDLIFYRDIDITDKMVKAFDEVVRAAAESDTVMELNANGIRNHRFKYPTDLLIELCKKYNAKVAVSSDCHNPNELYDKYVTGLRAYAELNGLNVVDDLR